MNLTPLPIFIESEAARWAYRIKASHNLKPGDLTGHLSILQKCEAPEVTCTDYMATRFHFSKNYSISFIDRETWTNDEVTFPCGSLVYYTDGSKLENGSTGAGVYGPRLNLAIPMGTQPTVFQAEIHAIRACVAHCADRAYRHSKIFIISDSRASLLALDSHTVESKLVWECMLALNTLGEANKVTLMWAPGHAGIHGNETADALAREGSARSFIGPEPFGAFPRSHQAKEIQKWEEKRKKAHWRTTQGLRQSKIFLNHSNSYTEKVLDLSKTELKTITGALTGHCPVRYHLKKIGKVPDDKCRFCNEEAETAEHVLCACPAVMNKRLSATSSRFLSPDEVMKVAPRQLARFFGGLLTGWD